jgi:hypothetical protein
MPRLVEIDGEIFDLDAPVSPRQPIRREVGNFLSQPIGPRVPAPNQVPGLLAMMSPMQDTKDIHQGLMDVGRGALSLSPGQMMQGTNTTLLGALGLIPGAGDAAKAGIRKTMYDAPYSRNKIHPDRHEELNKLVNVQDNGKYVPHKTFNPEDISSDGFLLNLVGDRTAVGDLTRYAGKDISGNPITLDGGMGYMRGKGTGAWASDESVIKKLSKTIRGADGAPVYGTYMPMAGTGSDFANMTRKAAMRDFDPKSLRVKDRAEFKREFKAFKDYKKLKTTT